MDSHVVADTSESLTGEEEFNKGFILPTLIIQLRKILDQYPDDIQILKELIQNAEDAGATVVKFMYDGRTYGQDGSRLLCPGLAKYQGPALYAYNDAQFNEDDWKGIRMLLQSVKQNDPHKVGYFGMGFKSVFHITDLPSILSGDRLGIIDPLRQFFDATGSHAWNLSRDGPTVFRTARHQTDTYVGTFDCNLEHFESGCHSYPGTLLRFPLRTSPSALSDTVYGADRIRALLERFEEDGHLSLLFLRSVETIEIYERSPSSRSSAAADPPVLRYRVSLADESLAEVRRNRMEFNEKIRRPAGVTADRAPMLDRPVVSTYPMVIRSTKLGGTGRDAASTTSITSGARYLVTNFYCGGPVSAAFRKLHRDSELRLLPCVGTAMSLDDVDGDRLITSDTDNDEKMPLLPYSEGGRVFCFLPLPDDGSTCTGLPIHVNGSFALEANRKHLKWPSSSTSATNYAGGISGSTRAAIDEHLDRRLLWNQCLLREVLPYAYAAMLIEAIRMHGSADVSPFPVSALYRAIPNFDGVDRRWECLLPGLFGELFKQASVYTPAGGGQWIEPRHAVFDTVTESATDAEAASVILAVLREAGVKITDAPPHVQLAIRRCCRFTPTEITPTVVSVAVRTVQHRASSGVGDGVFRIDWDSKLRLLRYFLRRGRCDLLDGLDLLPLANGGFETFRYNPRKADRPIYVAPNADIHRLLLFGGCSGGGLEDDFLEMEIDKDIRKMLFDAIKKGFTQLKVIDGPLFCQLLPRALPKHWTNPTTTGLPPQAVEWRPGGERGQPPAGWLELVWRYLAVEAPDDLGPVDRLPLVPAKTSPITTATTKKPNTSPQTRTVLGKGTPAASTATASSAVVELVPLYSATAAACVVRKSDGGLSLGSELESIVSKLGVRIVDALPDYVRAHPLVEKNYVFTASYIGVLRAVERQSAVDGRRRVVDRFAERLSAVERRKLRELFAKVSDHELQPEHRELLGHLPLFETVENNGGRRHVTPPPSSTSNFACSADVSLAAPVERIPGSSSSGSLSFPVSKKLLDVSTPDALALARLLGVRRLEPAELLIDVVFGDVRSGFHDVAGVRRVAVYVFHHYQRLSVSDPRFRSAFQTLAFIERRGSTANNTGSAGTFVTADQLYDPEDELLRRLFVHDDRWYPAQSYCDPTSLIILRDIGLRKAADLTPADLVQTAFRIAELAAEARMSPDRIGDKSTAVLDYLQRYPDMLDRSVVTSSGCPSTVANVLSGISWVRRLVNRPSSFYPSSLPWYPTTESTNSRQSQFHCPSEMVPRRFATAVGSSMPTVAMENLSAAVERAFEWDTPPPIAIIVRHLSNVVSAYSGRDKPMYADISRSIYSLLVRHVLASDGSVLQTSLSVGSSSTSVNAIADDSVADDSDTGVFEESSLPETQSTASTTMMSSIISSIDAAGLRSWVWHGDGFSAPDRVVLAAPTFTDLRPYVYGLPTELVTFHDRLLLAAGVRSACRLTDVLRSIKCKYDKSPVTSSPQNKTGLVNGGKSSSRPSTSVSPQHPQHQFASSDIRRDLHICVSVLNELKSQIASGCFETDDLEALRLEIFLPVHSDDRGLLKMAPLAECTYCDEEWLRQGYNMSDFGINVDDGTERISLVHANVPTSTSELLGVPTLMSRMLAAEQTLDFGFGQTDSLTGRLKALLEDYSDGLAIPKELIQNADDAGATEVRFLYDERDNTDAQTCLLDDGMRECQGPALWVYNDAVFTDTDFENITRLGAATKLSRNDQIGRFGLGFNAVYNLTDVPSFLSCHNVVIFDPQCNHLGRCIRDKSRPGVRIDLRRHRRSLRRFGNQFRPWDGIFGCDLLRSETPASRGSAPTKTSDSFPGTLFRLPLRTAAQAARSEICNRPYDDREMKDLLKMIVSTAESLLLFAQNVVRIGIYHLPKKSSNAARDVIEIFNVERKLVRIIRELNPVVDLPLNASKLFADNDVRRLVRNSCLLRSSTLAMSQLRSGIDSHGIPTPDCSLVVDITSLFCGKQATTLLNQSMTGRRQTWLIRSVMGLGDSFEMALAEDNLIPTASVAVRLEQFGTNEYRPVPLVEPNSNSQPTGYAFSFMPLPIRTGLPVHINGCFLVTSSRKQLCQVNEDDKFDPRPNWNRALLRDAVQVSYVRALQDIATLCNCQSADELFQLWPNPELASVACDALVHGFYCSVTNSDGNTNPCLFSDGQKWVSAKDTFFLEGSYASSSVGSAALAVFRQFIPDSSKIVSTLPEWIETSLLSTGGFENITGHHFTKVRFFEELFLPNIGEVVDSNRDRLLIEALTSNCQKMHQLLQKWPSIPCSLDGQLTEFPHNLVDPSSSLASVYLVEDGKFPNSAFTSPDVLRLLRELGMKHDSSCIDWIEVIGRAKVVSHITERPALRRFIAGLIGIIEHKLSAEVEESSTHKDLVTNYGEQLCGIAFFPLAQKPDVFPLPWFGDQLGIVAKPDDLFSSHYRDLICCIRPLADIAVIEQLLPDGGEIESFLHLEKTQKIPCDLDVVMQLKTIVNYTVQNGVPGRGNERDEFQRVLFKVCDFLETRCSDDAMSRQVIGENLSGSPFILVADQLVAPDRVAIVLTQDCSPYLFSLPDNYRHRFGDLVVAAGVQQHFDTGPYVSALRTMSEQWNSSPLNDHSLKVALHLVTLLNDTMTSAGRTMADVVDADGTIFIPDSNGILRSAAELCYNEPECQWMQSSTEVDIGDDISRASGGTTAVAFSHPLIPYTMSQQLGVSTRRHDVLQRHSRGLAFGQRERLTARLRRILAAYPCDRELLNEMVQNADDAGATTIVFVKDPRQHGHQRVFDPAWRHIQGPALCIYNDRTFTEHDLAAIQRLGEGRKGTDPNSTGQYGVGFNCVYHLTDVPSFLTGGPDRGGTLCVFDPHANLVPGATRDEPGRRFTDIPRLKRIFTDVFSGYLEDKGFDLVNGTMFRLPLRDGHMAAESELSDQIVTLDTVDRLFARFRPEMFDCLLFLNSIRSIQLGEIDEHSGNLRNTYTVIATLSPDDQAARDEFTHYAKKVSADISNGTALVSDIVEREIIYKVRLSDNHGHFETWLVTQRLGFSSKTEIPQVIIDGFRRGELMLMPRGGTAALIESSDSKAIIGRARRVSCFLPLPIKLELPVSINGHFALDHESRRNLWHDDIGGSKTAWNNTLLRNVIAPSYVALLRGICESFVVDVGGKSTQSGICSVEHYCRLFPPLIRSSSGYWRTLIESFYSAFALSNAALFPVIRDIPEDLPMSPNCLSSFSLALVEWHSLQKRGVGGPLFFDNLGETFAEVIQPFPKTVVLRRRLLSESNPPKSTRADALRRVLLRAGFNLIAFPAEVCESFVIAGVGLRYISPSAVMEFCSSDLCHAFDNLPTDIINTPFTSPSSLKLAMEYCMLDSDYFFSHLDRLPLLLTQDEKLSRFSVSQPTFLSQFYHLFPGLESHFVHSLLCESVFANLTLDTFEVFHNLDVQSLFKLLPKVLPVSVYGPPNVTAYRANEDNGPPTGAWLMRLWSFLRLQYENCLTNTIAAESNRKLAFDTIQPLAQWCLLPVKVRNVRGQRLSSVNGETATPTLNDFERALVPIGRAPIVFDHTHAGIMNQSICRCLAKLGIAELDCESLDGGSSRARQQQQSLVSPSSVGTHTTGSAVSNSSFARLLVSTLDHPDAVIQAVGSVVTDAPLLSREDCFCLLRYLADSIQVWRYDDTLCRTLRSACLFVTITGDVTSLASAKHVYVVGDHHFPQCDIDVWIKNFEVVFLQHHHSLVQFYEALGYEQLSVLQFYLDFVFPNFVRLSSDSRLCYLEFLRDSFLPRASLDNRATCVEWLRRLEFIPSVDASVPLRRANAFYDPQHQLLKQMITAPGSNETDSLFPGAPFIDHKWLDFLRVAGIRTDVGADMFQQFAKSIASEVANRGVTPSACERSRILVTHLFRSKELKTPGFIESLADIRFIASSQGSAMLQKIHPAYERKTPEGGDSSSIAPPVFISFQEGIPERYEPLCWTTAHLLPDWANPYRLVELEPTQAAHWREVGARLRIVEKPPLTHVVDHVLNICNRMSENASSKPSGSSGIASQSEELKAFLLADTMKKIYRYLQSNIIGNDEQVDGYCNSDEVDDFSHVVERLSSAPCIVTEHGKTFLRPSQIVLNFYNDDQLVPFLYRLPSDMCEFREIFLRLGSTSDATPDQYSFVLASLYSRTEGQRLHPNELRLAFKAVRGLFASLAKLDEQCLDRTMDMPTLYLPTDDGFLTESSSAVYNDSSTLADRVKYINLPRIVNLSECGINPCPSGGYSEIWQLLPSRLRPSSLSSVVVQVLDERFAETRVVTPVTEKLRCQLSSRSFGSGLARLLSHEQHQRSSQRSSVSVTSGRHRSDQRQTSVAVEAIRRRFDRVEVYAVDRVQTYLADRASGLPLSDSDSESEWFVERRSATRIDGDTPTGEDDSWIIYIGKSVSDGEELQAFIADAVCEIAEGLLANSVHYLRPILSCAPHAISRTLDRLRVRPDHGRTGSDSGDRRRTALPAPGSFVPIEEHHLLREEFDEFEQGEYVGYELDEKDDQADSGYFETTIVYAIVIRKIDVRTTNNENTVDNDMMDPDVDSSRKADETQACNEPEVGNATRQRLTQKYLLNIGDDRRPVIAQVMNIYRFHRVHMFAPGSSQSPNRSPLSPSRSPLLSQNKLHNKSSLNGRDTAATKSPQNGSLNAKSVSNGDIHRLPPQDKAQLNGHHSDDQHINSSSPSPSKALVVKFTFDHRQTNSTVSCNTLPDEAGSDNLDVRISCASAEVTEALEAAWKLPEPQRRKVVRRLLLRWHPDKNIGDEQLATVVTQHIRAEMERLDTDEAWTDGRFQADPRNPFSGSESFRRNFADAYRFFFEQMNERAREQRAQRDRYREHFTREYSHTASSPSTPAHGDKDTSSAGCTSPGGFRATSPGRRTPAPTAFQSDSSNSFDSRVPPPTFASCNPQPAQARRFLRQARADLKSAENDLNCSEPAYEWVSFKSYQSAKKALKAALLHVDSSNPATSHDVVILAAGLDDPELGKLARDLDRLVADAGRKLYAPDPIDYAVIPHDEHTAESSIAARDLAAAILGRVGELITST